MMGECKNMNVGDTVRIVEAPDIATRPMASVRRPDRTRNLLQLIGETGCVIYIGEPSVLRDVQMVFIEMSLINDEVHDRSQRATDLGITEKGIWIEIDRLEIVQTSN